MTGKIFNESSNIYQDQAKILFDYYKTAAETIVAAEMEEECNKKDLIMQRDQQIAERDRSKKLPRPGARRRKPSPSWKRKRMP